MKKFAVAAVLLVAAMLPPAGFAAEQEMLDFATVQKAAEQGDAEAQNNLGRMYAKGQGVPKDGAKAAQWFQKAAEQGDVDAQFNLGVIYEMGKGVPKDDAKAVH